MHPAENPADEILDIVDEHDEVVGQAPRGEAYARGLCHRCAFIEVRDAAGHVFVHRRTATKLVSPSLYDMFVGGVVGTGESYDAAALREAEEELGVRGLQQPKPLFKFLYSADADERRAGGGTRRADAGTSLARDKEDRPCTRRADAGTSPARDKEDRPCTRRADAGTSPAPDKEDRPHQWWSYVYEVRCALPVRPQPEEVAWHAFLTDAELRRRLDEWPWVPDGLEAYHRLRHFRRSGRPAPGGA